MSLPVRSPGEKWCDWRGEPIRFVGPRPPPSLVANAKILASPKDALLRDPKFFVPGQLHQHVEEWKRISTSLASDTVLEFISKGVNAWSFVQPFKGFFAGKHYNSPLPPPMILPNSNTCNGFEEFITDTILERVANGSLEFWGKVGEITPPHLVMPITIEPTKPRMCHDERFLNRWIEDLPFKLDYLSDLPRYVGRDHFQTVCDDKSGYDHVSLTQASRTLFGLSWKGCYFVYTCLPFGWKASAFIYQSIGLVATRHIRSLGVPCSQYIDDRHIGQLVTADSCPWSDRQKAEAAAYITVTTLTSLGYTLALAKSCLWPAQSVRYLGYLCDSTLGAFILPEDKKTKFKILREDILAQEEVNIKSLQRFAGKTTSFSIAVPAARLYTRKCFHALSTSAKNPGKPVKIIGELRQEICQWRFLDFWQGHLPWFDERHRTISSFSDASNSGWGAIIELEPGKPQRLRDYWSHEDMSCPILIREALALRNTLLAAGPALQGSRVDGRVDSLPLVRAWANQGGKSIHLSDVIKSLYEICLKFNIALTLSYVPSRDNQADAPSRALSQHDCMLSASTWKRLQTQWGPHSIDLMSLDSNAQKQVDGRPLRHFTPWPTKDSSGVNAFAQSLEPRDNVYVFPPLILVGPTLRFLRGFGCSFTIVVPDVHPRRFWWPLIAFKARESICLGRKNARDVLLFPSALEGFTPKPLSWDLWAFRF